MEIFLDTFEYEAIEQYSQFIVGITTNPLILSKSVSTKAEFLHQLQKIVLRFPDLLITLQVTQNAADEMIAEARKIIEITKNVIVKVPLTFEGLKAIKEIGKWGVRINGTLCFSLVQARMAEDYGVEYISPFLGRMEGAHDNVADFVQTLSQVIKNSKILAASIRNLRHLEIAMQAGCQAITVNQAVFDMIFQMPLLLNGKQMFDEANRFKFI